MKYMSFEKLRLTARENQYVLRVFGYAIWVSCHFVERGWFRLFGRGIIWKRESEGLTFGQRNGSSKYIRFRSYIISYLAK